MGECDIDITGRAWVTQQEHHQRRSRKVLRPKKISVPITASIQSWADAHANLPSRARWNPFSREVSATENQDRQNSLAAELTRRSLTFLEGIGQHPSNNWPGEESFLVLGLDLEAAKILGERFEQNALVWCGTDGVPQLIALR